MSAMERYFSPRIPRSKVRLAAHGEKLEIFLPNDESEGVWSMVPDLNLPSARYYFGATVVDKTVYLAGGNDYQTQHTLNTVLALDLENTQEGWKSIPSMKVARARHSAIAVQGKIYVFGGYSLEGRATLASCEVYDPITRKWEQIPDMGQKRKEAAVAVSDAKIIIIGGFDDQRRMNTAEMFDTVRNQWVPLPVMSNARIGKTLHSI